MCTCMVVAVAPAFSALCGHCFQLVSSAGLDQAVSDNEVACCTLIGCKFSLPVCCDVRAAPRQNQL